MLDHGVYHRKTPLTAQSNIASPLASSGMCNYSKLAFEKSCEQVWRCAVLNSVAQRVRCLRNTSDTQAGYGKHDNKHTDRIISSLPAAAWTLPQHFDPLLVHETSILVSVKTLSSALFAWADGALAMIESSALRRHLGAKKLLRNSQVECSFTISCHRLQIGARFRSPLSLWNVKFNGQTSNVRGVLFRLLLSCGFVYALFGIRHILGCVPHVEEDQLISVLDPQQRNLRVLGAEKPCRHPWEGCYEYRKPREYSSERKTIFQNVWRTNRKEDSRRSEKTCSMTYRNLDAVDTVAIDCHVEGHVCGHLILSEFATCAYTHIHTENPAPQKHSPLGP